MNINIYLEDSLAKSLNYLAKKSHQSRNAIIREAVAEWVVHHQKKEWPKSIMDFQGVADFKNFELSRSELLERNEDDPLK